MRKQAVSRCLRITAWKLRASFEKSIARWTAEGGPGCDRDFSLVALSAGCSHTANQLHIRAEHLLDRTRGQRVLLEDDTYVYDLRHFLLRPRPPYGCADYPSKPGEALPEPHVET